MPTSPTPRASRPQRVDAFRDSVIGRDATVLACMRAIDRAGARTAMVCDEAGRLLALVTDGDLRRYLLRGGTLDSPAWLAANTAMTTVGPEVAPADALRQLMDLGVTCLPVVDAEGLLVGLHTFQSTLAAQELRSWAVVMVGGRGERLGELTRGLPKPMLPVDGRPLVEHVVRHLVSHGIRRIFLAVNYLGAMIEDHFGDGRALHCDISYLRETEPLGTGGPLTLLPERPDAPLVVMNGDLLTGINLRRMLDFHAAGGYAATLALREHKVEVPFGVVDLGPDGRVAALVEKPTLTYAINAGIYVIEPALLERIPRGQASPITDVWRSCLAEGLSLGGYPMQEAWIDIGVPEQYAAATQTP